MKILLFGRDGRLGWELERSLRRLGEVLACGRTEADFLRPDSLETLVAGTGPRIVVNAAAYTDVDRAESEPDKARIINSEAPAILARACRSVGAVLVHYSTDYVFDGKKGTPYGEDDVPRPLNVYGRTKLDGERAVLSAGGVGLVFRTSWLFSMRRDCFVTRMLALSRERRELKAVVDQIGSPTWTRALAEITVEVLAGAGPDPLSGLEAKSGLYHVAGRGIASRYEWARAILRADPEPSLQKCGDVIPARTSDFPSPAERPLYSALDCGRFEKTFGLRLPDWEGSLALAIREVARDRRD